MNITVTTEKVEDGKLTAKVVVDKKDVDAVVNKTYKDIAQQYNFQGFRRGHAPRPVINNIIGQDAIFAQATNDLVEQVAPMMLEELDCVPIARVDYGEDPANVVEHADYEINAVIPVAPKAELDSYDAPAIEMPPEEATEAEIKQQLDMIVSYRTTFEDVEEDRPAEEGDDAACKVENVENGERFAGENRLFDLSSKNLPSEFTSAIIGMKKGEEKEISWTDEQDVDGEKKEVKHTVKVTLTGLKHAVTPELDDEMVKKNFGFDTVDELRNAVKEEIEEDKKNRLPELKEDRVVEAMGKHLVLDEVPKDYSDNVFNELASQFLQQLQRQGLTLDSYLHARGISTDEFMKDLREQADERARQSLALDALVDKLGLDATDEDVRSEFEKAGMPDVDASIADFKKEGRLPAIRESIRRTKAVDWLVENCTVTVVDEAAKADEDDKAEEGADAAEGDAADGDNE